MVAGLKERLKLEEQIELFVRLVTSSLQGHLTKGPDVEYSTYSRPTFRPPPAAFRAK
jgi:hypothetical protein